MVRVWRQGTTDEGWFSPPTVWALVISLVSSYLYPQSHLSTRPLILTIPSSLLIFHHMNNVACIVDTWLAYPFRLWWLIYNEHGYANTL